MTETFEGHGTGWIPDLPDHRDWHLPTAAAPRALPPAVDLRSQAPPVDDQLSLGSCTANSTGSMDAFVDRKQGGLNIKPSRLQIYYDARALDGFQDFDRGAYIRSALKTLADKGTAPEELWPYVTSKVNEKPPQAVYDAATEHQAIAYMRVDQTEAAMKGCLADGYPFVLGFTMYENFQTPEVLRTGVVQMPQGGTIGGHAVLIVGYDDSTRRWLIQNSWGVHVGQAGFFTMPYDYLTSGDLANDLWTIRSVEEIAPQPKPEPPQPKPEPKPEPSPVDPPVIYGKPKYKHKRTVVVNGSFSPTAELYLDGNRVAVTVQEGQFKFESPGLTGSHMIRVVNPDGQETSRPFVAN